MQSHGEATIKGGGDAADDAANDDYFSTSTSLLVLDRSLANMSMNGSFAHPSAPLLTYCMLVYLPAGLPAVLWYYVLQYFAAGGGEVT